ncbi:hypothetical protein O4H48_21040 [Rhodobacteraceae bacterium G21628-S1]|nr:hypothetical protein [Rhodobacteraceae bacterium G21628-S1]
MANLPIFSKGDFFDLHQGICALNNSRHILDAKAVHQNGVLIEVKAAAMFAHQAQRIAVDEHKQRVQLVTV